MAKNSKTDAAGGFSDTPAAVPVTTDTRQVGRLAQGSSESLSYRAPESARGAPTMQSRPKFFAKIHPHDVTVVSGRVIHKILEASVQDGVNNSRSVRDSRGNHLRWDFTEFFAAAADQGIVIVKDHSDVPDSWKKRGVTSYMVRAPGRDDVFIPAWVDVFAGSDVMNVNDARLLEFYDHLLDRGIVTPPTDAAIQRELQMARDLLASNRLRANGSGRDVAPQIAERISAHIAALQAELESRAEVVEPLPLEPGHAESI